jgi:uncharacterized membrane protein
MTRSHIAQILCALGTVLASAAVQAHEGHGLSSVSHWHSTDVFGFVAAAAVGMAVFFGGRK